MEYAYVLVTSKSKDGGTLPIKTNCWFSTADGNTDIKFKVKVVSNIVVIVIKINSCFSTTDSKIKIDIKIIFISLSSSFPFRLE